MDIKLTELDQKYRRYRKNLAFLDYLTRRRRSLVTDLQLLPYMSNTLTPQEYTESIEKRRAELQKELSSFKKPAVSERAALPEKRKLQLADYLSRVFYSPARGSPKSLVSPVVFGASGPCKIYLHHIENPTDSLIIENRDIQSDSSLYLLIYDDIDHWVIPYGGSNGFRCSITLEDKTHWCWVDKTEYLDEIAVHRYDIPAPECDSLVIWDADFEVYMGSVRGDAETGWLRVAPILLASPTGSTPSWSELVNNADDNRSAYSASIGWSNGPEDLEDRVDPVSFRDHYRVQAGITSSVYFGISVDLMCKDGTVGGTPRGYLIPHTNYYFSGPGIHYFMWPESMLPNW